MSIFMFQQIVPVFAALGEVSLEFTLGTGDFALEFRAMCHLKIHEGSQPKASRKRNRLYKGLPGNVAHRFETEP